MGRSGSSRTVVAAAFNFKNPFGGNSDEEEDAEEDEVAEPVIFDDLQPDGLLLRLLMGVHEIVQSLHRF